MRNKAILNGNIHGVFAVDADLKTSLVTPDVQKPNGVAVSPNGTRLYVAEFYIEGDDLLRMPEGTSLTFGPVRVLAYDLDGVAITGDPKIIVHYGHGDGQDGMITDTDGNLYVAARAEPDFGIEVYSPAGQLIDKILTPTKPTNVAFGRDGTANLLYITAGGGLYQVELRTKGWHPD